MSNVISVSDLLQTGLLTDRDFAYAYCLSLLPSKNAYISVPVATAENK